MTKLSLVLAALSSLVFCASALADEPFFGFQPFSNEISVYQNFDDDGNDKGQTLQLVFINGLKLGTDFSVEFTADFNRNLAWSGKRDYYYEIGLVKQIMPHFAANIQRLDGTFMGGPVNQVGVRFKF